MLCADVSLFTFCLFKLIKFFGSAVLLPRNPGVPGETPRAEMSLWFEADRLDFRTDW